MARDGTLKLYTDIDRSGANKGLKLLENSVKKLGLAIAAVFSIGKIIEFGKASLQAVSDLEAANVGLLSMLNAQGKSFKEANKFIDEYISDGLIPATNAINAYKNLSLRGYDTSQIEAVMIALKDSSAFARQSGLSMGEAIQTATEGLKNENSVLVDNAGVTKNVAKMWADYATSIGTTANNLTQQQKIQAEVNGILEETKFQVGDAARITQTYQGQVLSLQFAINNLKIAFGNFLKPIVQAVIPVITTLINWLTRLFNILSQVTALLFGSSRSLGGQAAGQQAVADSGFSAAESQEALADGTKKAAKEAKGALAAFDELNVLQKDTGSGGDGSGGGTSTGSAGGGGSFVPEELPQMEIDPKIAEIVEKLRKALEPTIEALKRLGAALEPLKKFAAQALLDFYTHFLKPVGTWVLGEGLPRFIDAITNGLGQINWDMINSALVSLWQALAPFAINIGEGLLWLWENVLVPLAVWTISEVLPRFIEILASGIQLLNAIIEKAKPALQWLWDNFLLPIASWTGEQILGFLDLLKEGIDWLTESILGMEQADFNGLLAGIAVAAGAIAVAANWGAITGAVSGLATAFTAVGTALGAVSLPIVAIVAAVAALVAGFVSLYSKSEEFRNQIQQLGETWKATLEPFATFLVDTFVSIWRDILAPTIDYFATEVLPRVMETLENLWQYILVPLADFIGTVLQPVFAILSELLSMLWQQIVLPLAQAVGTVLAKAWEAITDILNKTVIPIINKVIEVLKFLWVNVIEPIVNVLWTVLQPAFEGVFTSIGGIIEGIKNIFGGLIDFIAGVFTGDWSRAWQGIQDIFKGIWDALVGIVKIPLNLIIGLVNGIMSVIANGVNFIIRALNSLSFDVPDWVPGIGGETFGFNISEVTPPQIPYLASGAVLPPNKPFMAMVGDQKHGTNIEAPLSTIEEAVANVLAPLLIELIEATKNNQVVVTLDGEVIFKSNQKIGQNKGTNLVTGGGRI